MRRALFAISFFVALVAIWTALVRAQIWSPILLPSPASVTMTLRPPASRRAWILGIVALVALVLGAVAVVKWSIDGSY